MIKAQTCTPYFPSCAALEITVYGCLAFILFGNLPVLNTHFFIQIETALVTVCCIASNERRSTYVSFEYDFQDIVIMGFLAPKYYICCIFLQNFYCLEFVVSLWSQLTSFKDHLSFEANQKKFSCNGKLQLVEARFGSFLRPEKLDSARLAIQKARLGSPKR